MNLFMTSTAITDCDLHLSQYAMFSCSFVFLSEDFKLNQFGILGAFNECDPEFQRRNLDYEISSELRFREIINLFW